MVKNQGERWWNKVEQRHDRSGIGSLVRPEDIYISPVGPRRPPAPHHRLRSRSARRRRRPRRRTQRALRDRVRHAPDAALPRLHPRAHRSHPVAHAAGGAHPARRRQPGRGRTPRRSAAGVSGPLPARFALRAARLLDGLLRVQLSRRRSPHAGHRQDAHRRRRADPRPRQDHPPVRSSSSARRISPTKPT